MKTILKFTTVMSLTAGAALGCASKPTRTESPQGAPAANASAATTVPLIGSTKAHRYSLDNGLRLIVVEDHSSPTFAYQTWFRVGSRDEEPGVDGKPGRTGLAHLFEHMMFKETKNLKDGEFDKIMDKAGAEGENAFTSRDYTAYVQELPSDKLDLITRLEADRMVNLLVNETSFKTETDVVQNERRFRNENSPDGLMYQDIFEIAFKQHPYRWPVIGYQQDLDSMNARDAEAFYTAHYSPNHATIVVVGDVQAETVYQMVRKYYSALPSREAPPRVIPDEPEQKSPRRKTLKLNMQVDKILIGYHIPAATHDDIPALQVLQGVLTGGKSSRLHRALVETGIASSVGSYSLDDKDPSLFLVNANLQKGRKAAQAEAVILREFARLNKESVSDKEMERAKNRLNFEFYQGLDTNSEKANFIGHYESIARNFEAGLELQKKITAVTPAQVQDVARKYLNPNNRSVIVGVPK